MVDREWAKIFKKAMAEAHWVRSSAYYRGSTLELIDYLPVDGWRSSAKSESLSQRKLRSDLTIK